MEHHTQAFSFTIPNISLPPLCVSDSLSSGKEAEKDIEEHFAKCMNALAARKAVLLGEAAHKITSQSMIHIIFLIVTLSFLSFS